MRRWAIRGATACMALATACSDDHQHSHDDADTTTSTDGDTSDGTSDDGSDIDEFTALVGQYNLLVTIAGAGQQRDMGIEWQAGMEGGPATSAELSRPHIAMADLAGNIYIADKEAHAVRKVDPDGVITTVAGTNVLGDDGDGPGLGTAMRLGDPNGLWVRSDGVVYILDLDNGKVRRLDADGTMTTLFAVPGGITSGRGLWVADDEKTAYVADGKDVLVWRDDEGVSVFARGFADLGNLAMDPNGNVVVTDRAGDRVYRLSSTGAATVIAGNGTPDGGGDGEPALETGLDEVRAVWFLPNGGYFLGTHEGNQVWYVDTKGVIHLFLDGGDTHAHSGDGLYFRSPGKKVSEVRAITVDYKGNVLVTENDFGYVRAVLRNGP